MSEQTPNSTEDLSGAEPSMEDILASIRKIISEDEPVAMESPEDVAVNPIMDTEFTSTPSDLTSDAVVDMRAETHVSPSLHTDADTDVSYFQSAEGESVDLDIDDVLAGLENDGFEADSNASPSTTVQTSSPAPMELDTADTETADTETTNTETDDDIMSLLGDDIALMEDEEADFSVSGEAPVETLRDMKPGNLRFDDKSVSVTDADDEMDALLDDILMAPDHVVSEDVSETMSADIVEAPVEYTNIEAVRVESDENLDLVKSLMADLADDPDAMSADEDLDALLAIPEAEEEVADFDINELDAVLSEPASVDMIRSEPDVSMALASEVDLEEEEDILGDILNMTLDDEIAAQPSEVLTREDVAAFEATNISENADVDADIDAMLSEIDAIEAVEFDVAAPELEDGIPSLAEIAAAAEADAEATERSAFSPVAASVGMTAGLAALAASAAPKRDDASDETHAMQAEPTFDPAPETPTQKTETDFTPEKTQPTLETPMAIQVVQNDAILDEVTESAAAGAFAQLNNVVEDKAIFNERGPRIGDLVQEALRPMLKEWLDANLKGIVERAVAKEVKRISSGK